MADWSGFDQASQDLKDAVKADVDNMDSLFQQLQAAMSSGSQERVDAATKAMQDSINALKDAVSRDPSAPVV